MKINNTVLSIMIILLALTILSVLALVEESTKLSWIVTCGTLSLNITILLNWLLTLISRKIES